MTTSGNSSETDGTGLRITELQYDVLGRMIMVRRPAFDADITPETGTTIRLVTPLFVAHARSLG